jgi:hypothetical protein
LKELYIKTMDAIDEMTPGAAIYYVEGGGQTGLRGVNWGNGFATDPGVVARFQLSGKGSAVLLLTCSPWQQACFNAMTSIGTIGGLALMCCPALHMPHGLSACEALLGKSQHVL